MRRTRRAGVGFALALAATGGLAGCSLFDDDDPAAEPTVIASAPAAGADLVCGMARADVATATGRDIGRVVGEITASSADEQECEVWPADETLPGAMVTVRVGPADSDEGTAARQKLDGDVPGDRAPDVTYQGADGGAWRSGVDGKGEPTTLGAVSVLFVGDGVVQMTSAINPEDRDAAEDLLPLSQQVAASAGLDGS